jgi:hypothetical protein
MRKFLLIALSRLRPLGGGRTKARAAIRCKMAVPPPNASAKQDKKK